MTLSKIILYICFNKIKQFFPPTPLKNNFMKKSLNLGNFKAVQAVAACCPNKYLHLIALCIFLQPSFSQNPVNFLTGTTYVGGYHIKCNGQSTGTINANPNFGTPPYTYLWNTGDTVAQIKNKAAGIYIVAISDSNQVVQTDTFELRQPQALVYQSTLSDFYGFNLEKNGGNKGFIQLQANGGTPPYRYLWSNGDSLSNRTNLTAGNYPFTIIDANQCSATGSATITQPTPVQVNITNIQHSTCFDESNGSAQLQISGGLGNFSVAWDNGSFSLNPSDLKAGNNNVRIFEQGRTILDTIVQINEPNELNIEFTTSQYANGYQVSCVDCYNGTISSTITGGTAPYTYTWDDDNSSTTPNLSGLNGGDYSLMLLDANNCKAKMATKLRMPNPQDWSRFGNANIDSSEFIGSTDTSALVFKSNNQEALRLMGNGNVGMGTASPTEKLEVNGIIKAQGLKVGNFEFKLEPATALLPEIMIIGRKDILPIGNIMPRTCLDPLNADRINLFDGAAVFKLQTITPGGSDCKLYDPSFYVGLNGCDGVLEVDESNGNSHITNKLLLNTFCGKDVIVGKSTSGNLIANYKVGIGTSAPTEKLHVMGNGIINENLFVFGKVGIGTNTPNGILDIKTSNDNNLIFGSASGSTMNWGSSYIGFNASRTANTWTIKGDGNNNGGNMIYANAAGDLMFCNFASTGGNDQTLSDETVVGYKIKMKLTSDGRFGIGIDPNASNLIDYKFIVDGKIRCRGIRMDNDNWADYVFESAYQLMPLNELESFIKINKHLPNFMAEKQLTEEGIDLEKTLIAQQKTIEELVLYVIKLNKEIEALKK